MEVVRVTEAAAIASAKWMGRGLKIEADDAATTAMRVMFDTIPMHATVVIGEGEMDEAPMLYIGEELGLRNGGPEVDIAVDPLEGTNIVAKGTNGAMTVLAIADRGNLLNAPDMYMEKIAEGDRKSDRCHPEILTGGGSFLKVYKSKNPGERGQRDESRHDFRKTYRFRKDDPRPLP